MCSKSEMIQVNARSWFDGKSRGGKTERRSRMKTSTGWGGVVTVGRQSKNVSGRGRVAEKRSDAPHCGTQYTACHAVSSRDSTECIARVRAHSPDVAYAIKEDVVRLLSLPGHIQRGERGEKSCATSCYGCSRGRASLRHRWS